MTQPLAGQISQAAGLPASVRIGTVVQADPLLVSVQGAQFAAEALGVLQGGTPTVGAPVALVGQSALSGGDPASWLVLGAIRPGTSDASITVSDSSAPNEGTTSIAYVPLTTTVGVAFIAPSTGRVMIHYKAYLTCAGGSLAYLAPEVLEGDTIGTGTPVLAASDANALFQPFGSTLSFSGYVLLEDLTPGSSYTVRLLMRSSAGANVIAGNRDVTVVPAP